MVNLELKLKKFVALGGVKYKSDKTKNTAPSYVKIKIHFYFVKRLSTTPIFIRFYKFICEFKESADVDKYFSIWNTTDIQLIYFENDFL